MTYPSLTPKNPEDLPRQVLRLLIVPFLVYLAWLIECFLLEQSRDVFSSPTTFPLLFYTFVGCVLTGTVLPVLLIRRSFASGDVNMHQIGFRSAGRTILTCGIAALACYLVVRLAGLPYSAGDDFFILFLLYLPTGIASVMICWVLLGTHVQALVRQGGILISITTGVTVTAILLGLTLLVHTTAPAQHAPVAGAIILGLVSALFFFATRDVYAAVIVVTTGLVAVLGGTGAALPAGAEPGIFLSAATAVAALLAVHLFFSRNYATVVVVPDT